MTDICSSVKSAPRFTSCADMPDFDPANSGCPLSGLPSKEETGRLTTALGSRCVLRRLHSRP